MLFTKTAMTGDLEDLSARVGQELKSHKGKYIFQGTAFIIFGVLAGALPVATALSAELLIGIVLMLSGIFQLVLTIKSRMHWWSLLSSCLSMIVGILMIWKPLAGLLAVVTLMAIFMTVEGLFELFLAFEFRPVRNWNWMLFSGVITLILAAILWIGFPAFDVLYLGWVIAINLILYGISLLMLVWRVAS